MTYLSKRCGAPLKVEDGAEHADCPYCGARLVIGKKPKTETKVIIEKAKTEVSDDTLIQRAYNRIEEKSWGDAKKVVDELLR